MSLFDVEKIADSLLLRKNIRWFCDIPNEKLTVSDEVKKRLTECAESWDGYLHADYGDSYGEFERNKNRCNFEDLYINRRAHLIDLTFYEIFVGGGIYLSKIEELARLICSEKTWCVPAHANIKSPETTEHVLELYTSETASVLAIVSGFLGERLSKEINGLITEKIDERMFIPYTETDGYGWMGAYGQKVNNWNPWINSNILFTAALICNDEEKYRSLVLRAVSFAENYIKSIPDDCLCDEGVRYWNLSGACLFDLSEILYDLTGAAVDLTKSEQIKSACDYLTGMYDECGTPANYADATVDFYPECALLVRAGERTENPVLRDMGRAFYRKDNLRAYHDNFYRQLKDVYTASNIVPLKSNVSYPPCKFLKGINIFTMRKNGFFLSFKANHNGESHNHNDVGSFVVYYKGEKLFIDPGVDLYSGYTFSRDRNKLWYMRSDFHNLPTVCGELQKTGIKFSATPLKASHMRAETDVSGAYGLERESIRRSVDFSEDCIVISDEFKNTENSILNYMLSEMPRIDGNRLYFTCGVIAEFSGIEDIRAEKIDITGKNPPDGIIADAENRKTDGRSYLLPRLMEKQWGQNFLMKITAKPISNKITLKISEI